MADGKWITNLKADDTLADAARRVLTVRLQVVRRYLPKALNHWQEDAEHVHQLRVGTRRAGAALNIFSICLPKKVLKRSKNQLRELRQAAGAARDWDVFIDGLTNGQEQHTAARRPGLDFLLGYSQAQRIAAQASLHAVGENAQAPWDEFLANTIAAVRKPRRKKHGRTLCELAKPWLSEILTKLHSTAADHLDDYARLHQVRILGKRLRYGMEIFAPCFSAEFRTRFYPIVEEMQEILGDANDSHVASARLAGLQQTVKKSQPEDWKRLRAGIEGVTKFHQRRLIEQRRRFLKWWQHWQKSGADTALTNLMADR